MKLEERIRQAAEKIQYKYWDRDLYPTPHCPNAYNGFIDGANWMLAEVQPLIQVLEVVIDRHDKYSSASGVGVSNGVAYVCKKALAKFRGEDQ